MKEERKEDGKTRKLIFEKKKMVGFRLGFDEEHEQRLDHFEL